MCEVYGTSEGGSYGTQEAYSMCEVYGTSEGGSYGTQEAYSMCEVYGTSEGGVMVHRRLTVCVRFTVLVRGELWYTGGLQYV